MPWNCKQDTCPCQFAQFEMLFGLNSIKEECLLLLPSSWICIYLYVTINGRRSSASCRQLCLQPSLSSLPSKPRQSMTTAKRFVLRSSLVLLWSPFCPQERTALCATSPPNNDEEPHPQAPQRHLDKQSPAHQKAANRRPRGGIRFVAMLTLASPMPSMKTIPFIGFPLTYYGDPALLSISTVTHATRTLTPYRLAYLDAWRCLPFWTTWIFHCCVAWRVLKDHWFGFLSSTGIHAHPRPPLFRTHAVGARHLRVAESANNPWLPVAAVMGCEPKLGTFNCPGNCEIFYSPYMILGQKMSESKDNFSFQGLCVANNFYPLVASWCQSVLWSCCAIVMCHLRMLSFLSGQIMS